MLQVKTLICDAKFNSLWDQLLYFPGHFLKCSTMQMNTKYLSKYQRLLMTLDASTVNEQVNIFYGVHLKLCLYDLH